MELEDAINLNELLRNPTTFKIDNEHSINKFDNDLMNGNIEEEEKAEVLKTPWSHSFDELKLHMTPIPNYNIYKRIMTDGIGDVMGRRKTRLHWSYSMFNEKADDSYDSSFMGGEHVKINLWDEVMPGIWLALETMKKGEESQFVIDYKLMFGELGHEVGDLHKIKPQADVLLVAKLVDFEEIGAENACENLTDEELRTFSAVKSKALEMLAQTKDLNTKGSYAHGINVGLQIIDRLRFCEVDNDEEIKEKCKLIDDVFIELIDCYVKVEKYKKALSMISQLRESMDVDKNINLLVNEAIAYNKLDGDFERSIELLRKAQMIDPHSKLVNHTLSEVQKKRDKYKNDTKEFMRKAFQVKNQPAPKKVEKTSENEKLAEIVKSLSSIDIGSGIPLVGYTPNELKEIEDALKRDNQGYKLQVATGNDGKLNYTIKKSI